MTETSTQWWEIGIFTTTEEGLDRPDLMFHYGSVPFDMHTLRQGFPTTDNGFCLTPNVTHARSRGTVKLRSRDFRDKPMVDPRYFTDPHDMPTSSKRTAPPPSTAVPSAPRAVRRPADRFSPAENILGPACGEEGSPSAIMA